MITNEDEDEISNEFLKELLLNNNSKDEHKDGTMCYDLTLKINVMLFNQLSY